MTEGQLGIDFRLDNGRGPPPEVVAQAVAQLAKQAAEKGWKRARRGVTIDNTKLSLDLIRDEERGWLVGEKHLLEWAMRVKP